MNVVIREIRKTLFVAFVFDNLEVTDLIEDLMVGIFGGISLSFSYMQQPLSPALLQTSNYIEMTSALSAPPSLPSPNYCMSTSLNELAKRRLCLDGEFVEGKEKNKNT